MAASRAARPRRRAPTPQAALATLGWLLKPIARERFFHEIWERQPLVVHRRRRDAFAGLFSLDEADRVLTTLDRRYPDVTLKDARRELTAEDYSGDDERIDAGRVWSLFAAGATVTLAFLDDVVPALGELCRGLEAEFSCPCQANVYLTPPGAQGAKPHYDTHDVFVLQIAGAKRWTLFDTPIEAPLAGQDYDAAQHPIGAPSREFELQPGELAYVPRGLAHQAVASDAVSLHITVGLLRTTWADLLLESLAGACLRDAALRKALPPGFARPGADRAAALETAREQWRRAERQLDIAGAFELFAEQLAAARPPSERGRLAQFAAAARLRAGSRLGRRPGAGFAVGEGEGGLRVELPDRAISIPAAAAAATRFALARARFQVRELPGLDAAGRLVLARRLVREGLLRVLA